MGDHILLTITVICVESQKGKLVVFTSLKGPIFPNLYVLVMVVKLILFATDITFVDVFNTLQKITTIAHLKKTLSIGSNWFNRYDFGIIFIGYLILIAPYFLDMYLRRLNFNIVRYLLHTYFIFHT